MLIEVVAYRSAWPREFDAAAGHLRATLGDTARALHHIGSTSVPGLLAKDVIDVQVTVAELGETAVQLLAAGYAFHADLDADHAPPGVELRPRDLEKRTFTERPGERRANLHVRVQGAFNQRYAVLFRDYLRAEPRARDAYGLLKHRLARRFPEDRERYYELKDPAIDMLMAGAEVWARATSWTLPPSDA